VEVRGDKKSTQIFVDNSPVFIHIVSKLVQALVITYDEILKALVVEGDILLPKPILNPTPPHPPYGRDSTTLDLHGFGKPKRHLRGRRFPSYDTVKAKVQKWLREQDISFHRRVFQNLILRYDKCLKRFGKCVEK
jgi:hypothetical protein